MELQKDPAKLELCKRMLKNKELMLLAQSVLKDEIDLERVNQMLKNPDIFNTSTAGMPIVEAREKFLMARADIF